MTEVKIIADSISPDGDRLTTFEAVFPRLILAELNTHRMLSRNSASSRAIPPERIIDEITENPFVPTFNKRVKGMGVGAELTHEEMIHAERIWLQARADAILHAHRLLKLDVDKSRVNRLLEPFMWHTALITATEWSNFFALRTAKEAQPEFRVLALLMQEAYHASSPQQVNEDQWHLPLIKSEDRAQFNTAALKKISVGRCARVSYLTHDGHRDPKADITLHNRLLHGGHMSPFEHVATPVSDGRHGNFYGWKQYRKYFSYEHDFSLA